MLFQVEVAHRILRLFTSQTTQGQCLWRHSKLFARKREDDSMHGAQPGEGRTISEDLRPDGVLDAPRLGELYVRLGRPWLGLPCDCRPP